jgi:ethanolamine utilization protein EutN
MLVCRVLEHIVATAKAPSYVGHKILKVIPENLDGEMSTVRPPIIALDLIDAGVGDRVLVCQEGRWAREAIGDLIAPVRSIIVAVVEGVELDPAANARPPMAL